MNCAPAAPKNGIDGIVGIGRCAAGMPDIDGAVGITNGADTDGGADADGMDGMKGT